MSGAVGRRERARPRWETLRSSLNERGERVARRLQARYRDRSMDGGHADLPAFVRSGLLIRSTVHSEHYFSWRPNPDTAPWGVSMSWLREDCDFADVFPTANGFVVYPEQEARRRGLACLNVRCVYPSDSWSAAPDRGVWHEMHGRRSKSVLCHEHEHPIRTAEAWIAAGYDDDDNQSAFAVHAGHMDRAEAWRQMIEVRRLLALRWRNEVVVDSWLGLDDRRMPIEAFFYCPSTHPGKPDALADARWDQVEFAKITGRRVPIIRWDPTDPMKGAARFTYREVDQSSGS